MEGPSGIFLPDGRNGRAGIEIRINGELAAVTDQQGAYQLPPEVRVGALLEFAINGVVFHRAAISKSSKKLGPPAITGDGLLYGIVVDQDGVVPGTLVIVTNGDHYAFDVSNSSGIYTIHNAPTGQVLVIALAELHYPKINAIDLLPGVPYQLDIFIEKALGLGKLHGRAATPDGKSLSGVYVNFTLPGGVAREDLTNLYGMYELLDIPAGLGQLYAHKDAYHDVFTLWFVAPGFNEKDLLLIPIELGAVIGAVMTPGDDPVPGALVRLTYQKFSGVYDWMFTYSGEKGFFAFGDLPPGSYVVQSFLPGWHPGTAVGTVFEGTIQEEALTMWPTLETGTLEGWAVDFMGNPVPYAFGYVAYIGYEKEVSTWVVADANGHFLVDDVPYGPYAIRVESAAFLPAWAFSDILPNENNDFLEILYPFDPSFSGALTGTVNNAGGISVPFAIVGCWPLLYESLSFKTFADAQGRYLFPYLPPEVYGAFAFHPDVGFGTGFEQVLTGNITVLDIVLQ